MRVLYVSSPLEHNFGGGEKFIRTLIQALKDDEHEFLGGSRGLYDVFRELGKPATLATAGFEPVTPKNLLLAPVSFCLGFLHFLRFFGHFNQADVIVSPTSFTETFFVLPWVHLILGKKIVFVIQNNHCPKAIFANPLRPVLLWLWRRHQVIFMSHSQMQEWREKGVYTENCQVIHHGISLPTQWLSLHLGEPVRLGFLARIHEEKGLGTLLNAMAGWRPKVKVVLDIAGTGPDLEATQNLQNSLTFHSNIDIQWVGFKADPDEFYADLDLFVFPSRRESFGLVVIEAWAHGVPVLCSDIPVFQELKSMQLSPADRSLIFETDQHKQMIAKLDEFLAKLDEFRNLAVRKEIRRTVEQKFNLVRMADDYRQVFLGSKQ
jgi:glycosyltransferase involved in cell wall biosynthesis